MARKTASKKITADQAAIILSNENIAAMSAAIATGSDTSEIDPLFDVDLPTTEQTAEVVDGFHTSLTAEDREFLSQPDDEPFVLDEATIAKMNELEAEDEAERLEAALPYYLKETALDPAAVFSTLPTPEEITAALASIVTTQETASGADTIDHHSQTSSWTPIEATEEQKAERDLNDAVNDALGIEPELTLDHLRLNVAQHEAEIMVWNIRNQVDERETYEIAKAETAKLETGKEPNLNILGTLKKVRQQMVTMRAAKLLCAINVDPALMNRTIHTGARYNVYAIGKLSDVIYGVTDGVIRNAINIACMKSLFACSKAGVNFTMEAAKGACSKQYALKNLDLAVRRHLISHTVAESTASTQASSTMQALVTLGVVKTDGSGKNPSYTLTDSPITKKVRDLLAA